MRPGVNIATKESPPPLALPVESGTIFMVGITEKGPLAPVTSRTPTEWIQNHGARNTNTQLAYDSAEYLFKEGAKKIVTSRVVGPGAVTASVAVTESATTVFTARAKGPGVYGNDLNVVIRGNGQDASIPVGSFRIRVQTDAAVILEESYDLLDKAAALFWMDTVSQYITYTDGPNANDPTNGSTFSLASGNDDIAGITDTQWANAIALFGRDLGTGILIAPGRTSDAGHNQIKSHAEAFNRPGFEDAPDTSVIATITASVAAARSRMTGMFWPWVRVAGLTLGTYRLIPPSVIAAGIAARNDSLGLSPNKPAAGELGISRTALSLTQTVTDADHQTLNNAGVNVLRDRFNQRRVMGWRTMVAEASDPKWINLGNARLTAAIQNGAWLVGERFLFRELDGKGATIAEFGAALTGEVLMPFFLAGSLYGDSPEDAFRVDLSGNTATTAQNRQILADLIVVESEFGEEINISIAKQLITEGVGS